MAASGKNGSTMRIVFIGGIFLIAAMLVLNSQPRVINASQFQQNAVSVSADSIVETEPDKAEIYEDNLTARSRPTVPRPSRREIPQNGFEGAVSHRRWTRAIA